MPHTANPFDFLDRATASARGFGGWLGRLGFGLFVFVAAGFALLATTFIGVSLAVAALFLKMAHSFTRNGARKKSDIVRRKAAQAGDGDPPALEAHRTPDGWVVDNASGPGQ